MMTLTIDPTKEAETIEKILQDESSLLSWFAEYDSRLEAFSIRGYILVKDIPINARCYLSVERHRQGKWLGEIKQEIAHLIASQLLKKPVK